jgi:hypothetical protein
LFTFMLYFFIGREMTFPAVNRTGIVNKFAQALTTPIPTPLHEYQFLLGNGEEDESSFDENTEIHQQTPQDEKENSSNGVDENAPTDDKLAVVDPPVDDDELETLPEIGNPKPNAPPPQNPPPNDDASIAPPQQAEPERPIEDEEAAEEALIAENEPQTASLPASETQLSDEGTVGGPDVGGTYDGKDIALFQQISLPEQPILQHYDSTQNYWPLHGILRERGWSYATMALPSRVTMWISRGSVPPRLRQGYQMLNSMGVSGCIGGAKSLQLECRRRLARLNGCEYDILKIQPPQYNMLNLEDCKRFFSDAEKPERLNKVYLSKPTYTFHGAGIRIHQGAFGSLKAEFGACKTPKNTILMDYISNPATMLGGFKFDFRTYLLVASLKPQLVFYHDGFVRKSDRTYDVHSKDMNVHITNKVTQSKEEHFFNFTKLGYELHRELGLPADHLDTYVRPRAKQVTRFLFQTTLVQPQPPRHVPGRFHLFGIDWLLDAKGKLHLLEGNGYPLVTNYPGIGLTPKIWEEMTDLILAIQTKPQLLSKKLTVKDGFSFGGWKLVYNELEELMEQARGHPYNSCKAFGNS